MGTGAWFSHPCSGHGKGTSHKWMERWCHLEKPGADPKPNACGCCPIHCQCGVADGKEGVNNLPQKKREETIQQFVNRLARNQRNTWTPHNSE